MAENLPTITVPDLTGLAQKNMDAYRFWTAVQELLGWLDPGVHALVRVADGQTARAEEVDWCDVHKSRAIRGKCDVAYALWRDTGLTSDCAPAPVLLVHGVEQ